MFLVTGASGRVGRHMLDGFREAGLAVRAVSRDPDGASLPEDTEPYRADLTRPDSLAAALRGVEVLHLIVSGAEVPILELARRAGVRHVVLLSSRLVDTQPANVLALRHLRAEEAVRASGLSWTFVRPVQYNSNALRYAQDLREGSVVRAPFPKTALPLIDPADVAAVAVTAMTGENHGGQIYSLTGPEALTPPQQVATLAAVLGRELTFEEIGPQQARERMEPDVSWVLADAVLDAVGGSSDVDAEILPGVENVTGKPPRTFGQWAWDHRAHFSG
ncbi:SDR family oxidoreductase [Allosaccharopolyspora coralli]|nr:NAD(P)H-binding protein [Allosaccharopolyspora coralli]